MLSLSTARDCNAGANGATATSLLGGMAARRPDMRYALFDLHAALLQYIDNPAAYGLTEAKAACCGLKPKIGCTPTSLFCANRTSTAFDRRLRANCLPHEYKAPQRHIGHVE
jgi:phospholipase/lecithinase/hemolysin